ncbi:MAG: hypothetical protein K1Y02_26015 [Candidatus Hydrogenedentes bacterium]|nr:hypothetical protein [Candidatus Hydrogenedentota bacterium]
MSESLALLIVGIAAITLLAIAYLAFSSRRNVYFSASCPCCKKTLIVDGECVRRPHLEDEET